MPLSLEKSFVMLEKKRQPMHHYPFLGKFLARVDERRDPGVMRLLNGANG